MDWGILVGNSACKGDPSAQTHGVRLGAAGGLALPVADLLYGLVLVITFLIPFVSWRGRWFRVRRWSGRLDRELGVTDQAA